MVSAEISRSAGRPRADLDSAVLTATLRTVHERGYAGATVDRIAAAAGTAKTTLYRRWPSKGALVVASLVAAFGPLPAASDGPEQNLATLVRWGVDRIARPGVAAAFAGVFAEAVSDPDLRALLRAHLQEPYRVGLEQVLGVPSERVLLIVDVVVGTLLHRTGITGEPIADADLQRLTAMVQQLLR